MFADVYDVYDLYGGLAQRDSVKLIAQGVRLAQKYTEWQKSDPIDDRRQEALAILSARKQIPVHVSFPAPGHLVIDYF